jgi:predicted transcriptional regulator
LFVAILDASVPGHVTTKVSHKLISEYFTWTDAKVKKLIQRLTYDHWIAIHSERRGYWIKYEIHSKIVEAVGQEKPIELKKFSKIKQKEGVMRN